MDGEITVKMIAIPVAAITFAVSMYVAASWLLEDEPNTNRGGRMKKYKVYAEVTVTKEVLTVQAESEDEAIFKARTAAERVALDMGATNSDILWAEEMRE